MLKYFILSGCREPRILKGYSRFGIKYSVLKGFGIGGDAGSDDKTVDADAVDISRRLDNPKHWVVGLHDDYRQPFDGDTFHNFKKIWD